MAQAAATYFRKVKQSIKICLCSASAQIDHKDIEYGNCKTATNIQFLD